MAVILLLLLLAGSLFGQGTVISTGTWVPIAANGPPLQVFAYDKTNYVNSLDAHCIFGGFHQALTSERNNSLGCYSYSENRYFTLTRSGSFHDEHTSGMGHSVGIQWYDEDRDVIAYMSDGSGSNSQELKFGHLWEFDVAGLSQRDRIVSGTDARPWFTSSGTPSNSTCRDTINNKTLLFPNASGRGAIYNPTTNLWTIATATGQPPTLGFPAMAFNSGDGKCYIYGGTSSGSNIYSYDIATDTWAGPLVTTCTGGTCSTNKPPIRQAAFLAYSSAANMFLMGGGVNTLGAGTAFTDTWTFNPSTLAWTLLAPAASFPSGGNLNNVHERCQYDTANDVFVLLVEGAGPTPYAQGTWTAYYSKVYAYALAGSTPLNYGRTANTYTPTSGSLNRVTPTATSNSAIGTQSWAGSPALTVSGSTIYYGAAETGGYFDSTVAGATSHPVVQSTPNTGSWTFLGLTNTSIASEASGAVDSGHHLRLRVVNSVLWAAAEWYNPGPSLQAVAYAKSWNGSAWSGAAVPCQITGGCTGSNGNTSRPEDLIGIGTTPVLAVVENDHTSSFSGGQYLRVLKWNGTAWAELVAGKLNNSANLGSQVLGASLATDGGGTNAIACWNEEVADNSTLSIVTTNAQLFCKTWNGTAWSSIITGATLNQTSSSWAGRPAVTYAGSKYYVAWTERTNAGNPVLRAASWDGATFTVLGATTLNLAAGGWAANPTASTDGTNVYIGWEEQAALGSHSLGHMKKWNGSAWSTVGSSIAADTSNGSISGITCDVVGTSPTCAFSELKYGNLAQGYVMQFDGTSWTQTLGSVGPTISTTSPLTTGNVGIAYSASITATSVPASLTCTITAGALPGWATLNNGSGSCTITGTPNAAATSTFTVNVSNGVSPDASRAYSLTINTLCGITDNTLDVGTISVAYSFTLTTSGCAAPAFSWSGSTPSGYSINASTGEISGTTSLPGNYGITISVTDANAVPNPRPKAFVLIVGPPPQPHGASPGLVGAGIVK
jgi:hypothetical protein